MDNSYICIVTELMSMNLMEYLNDYYDELTKEQKLSIFAQISRAVHHCHEKGIMHRDVKLQNVLVNVDPDSGLVTDVKLADLGFACTCRTLQS